MSDSEAENRMKSLKLMSNNYNVWAIDMQGQLMTANAWWIVTGESKQPTDTKLADSWLLKKEEATGIIIRSLSHTQHIHIEGQMDDPIATWKSLKTAHQSQVTNSRYYAQKLFRHMQREYRITHGLHWLNQLSNQQSHGAHPKHPHSSRHRK